MRCIGTEFGSHCKSLPVAAWGGKKINVCGDCLRVRHINKITAQMLHASAGRASMAAFKTERKGER